MHETDVFGGFRASRERFAGEGIEPNRKFDSAKRQLLRFRGLDHADIGRDAQGTKRRGREMDVLIGDQAAWYGD